MEVEALKSRWVGKRRDFCNKLKTAHVRVPITNVSTVNKNKVLSNGDCGQFKRLSMYTVKNTPVINVSRLDTFLSRT